MTKGELRKLQKGNRVEVSGRFPGRNAGVRGTVRGVKGSGVWVFLDGRTSPQKWDYSWLKVLPWLNRREAERG